MTCEAIDDILKCLEELENQGQLSATAENQLQTVKFVLRYSRIYMKGKSVDLLSAIESCVENVEIRLVQPRKNGSMAVDLVEETLSSLLENCDLIGELFRVGYFYYSQPNDQDAFNLDVQIDELVKDWLDPLLENLKHLIHCDDLDLPDLTKKRIKEFEEKLISVRNFLEIIGKELEKINNITPRQGMLHKPSEDLLTRVNLLIENANTLSFGSWLPLERINTDKLFCDLLARINHIEPEIRMIYVQFLKASSKANPGTLGIHLQALISLDSLLGSLEELLKDQGDGSIIPLDDHQLAFLHRELSFLRYFLMDPHLKQYTEPEPEPEPESFTSLLMQVETMARKGASLTHSVCDGQKDMAKEMTLAHSNLLEIVNLLKAKIRQMYQRVPKPSTSSFPRTPKLGFLKFFLQNLEELLKHRADSIAYVKNEIETVQSELALLSSFIRDTIKCPEKDENIARRIMDVAYEAERVIDLISATPFPSWYYMLWLSDVIGKIKLLGKESTEVCSKKSSDISVLNMEKASIQARPLAYPLAPEEEVVGFNDEAENIIGKLIGGPKELDIVSIVGMPGLGKTTLAKKVYEHPSITRYFPVRSWFVFLKYARGEICCLAS